MVAASSVAERNGVSSIGRPSRRRRIARTPRPRSSMLNYADLLSAPVQGEREVFGAKLERGACGQRKRRPGSRRDAPALIASSAGGRYDEGSLSWLPRGDC